jgi:hypothetical protein
MKRLLVRRGAVGLALGALAATGLASVAAPAHAAIVNADVYAWSGLGDDGADPTCVANVSSNTTPDLPWSDNGVAVTATESDSGTLTAPGESTALSASAVTTVSSTPVAGGPATVKFATTMNASAVPSKEGTVCQGYASVEGQAQGDFTLAQPMWATMTWTTGGKGASGSGYLELDLPDGVIRVNTPVRTSGSMTALLPAGLIEMDLYGETDAYAADPQNRTASFTSSVTVELQPMGAAAAPAGKGAGYTQFGARDCATGNVAAAITKKAKKKAKQVVITVNGAKVAKFKGKKLKKRSLVLPAAPASAAEVVATITLKNGKEVTVTRSYLACS